MPESHCKSSVHGAPSEWVGAVASTGTSIAESLVFATSPHPPESQGPTEPAQE